MPVSPKVVLITGCSSGFGLLTAARLAACGHKVHATMRDLSKRERLELESARRGGPANLHIHQLDVTDVASINKTLRDIMAQEGVIDVLINNAGFGVGGFFEDLSDEDWRRQFDVNFFGVLNVTREVLPVMRPRRQGRIINVSSVSAFSGSPALSAYASSKWALEGFSECLRMELLPFNIDVILIEPASYRTRIFTENARYARGFDDPQSPYHAMSRQLKDFVDAHVRASNRDPEEIAEAIEHLVVTPRPRFRNIVGILAKARCWVARHLPFELYSAVIARIILRKVC